LKICYQIGGSTEADRPKTFTAEGGKTRTILLILKRVKP
jgi:hypothetical protein